MQFGITFVAVAAAAVQDFFEYTPGSNRPATILGWEIGQSTEAGDAADEQLRIEFITGYTTSGSGGTNPTPFALDGGTSTALGTTDANNTTLATGGTAVVRYSSAFNVRSGHIWMPPPELRIVVPQSVRSVLRLNSTPADSITFSGTLWFDE
jgi:hypothetical protein